MYKARVEAVSGTKILASGKWLQCIGNKNFRVGELAWTDGRCAYGNHYTPQQPLVITVPQDDEAIPILLQQTSATAKFEYYTFKKSLKLEKTSIDETLDYSLMANNQRSSGCIYDTSELDKIYDDDQAEAWAGGDVALKSIDDYFAVTGNQKETSEASTIDLSNVNDYFSVNKHFKTVKTNVWTSGRLKYYPQKRFHGAYTQHATIWQPDCISGGWTAPSTYIVFDKIEIEKNGDVVTEINVKPFAEETANDCPEARPFVFEEFCNYWGEQGGAADIIWSFIESENNWALLLLCEYEKFIDYDYVNRITQEYIDAYLATVDIDPTGFVEAPFPCPCPYSESRILTRLYYIDSQGTKKIVAEHLFKRPAGDVPYTEDPDEFYDAVEKTAGEWTIYDLTEIKFPLGNGYYYKSEEYNSSFSSHARYTLEKRKIFSPNDEVIFDGWFDYNARINICRVGSNRYLLTVNKAYLARYKGYYSEDSLGDTPFPQAGIHLLQKKDSTVDWKLLQAGDVVLNQCLQPMKKYKNWQNRFSVVSATVSQYS